MIKIEVNSRTIHARRGQTILSALKSNGIHVPTICSMNELSPTGACRLCVVEVEGHDNLVPACSFPVQEWMKIKTHSPRVLQARKTNVELLLSNHPDDCLYCERNGNCELQKLAEDLHVRERKMQGSKSNYKIDASSEAIVRDQAKCILCGRCVRICEEIMGVSTIDFIRRGNKLRIATAMAEPLQFSNCIDCGQCVVSCPTGALSEKTQFQDLHASLDDPDIIVAVQYTPAVTVSLAEEFGVKSGTDMKGVINTALRKIGFDHVFDASFGADVLVMEQVSELKKRFTKGERMPLITSSCPAWVNYVEEFKPGLLSNLTPIRSPHQIIGKLVKTWFAETNHIKTNRIHSVLITNCTASKYEATRPEYRTNNTPDIDFVITTRELARLIRLNGIEMHNLEAEPADGPFHAVTSAGKIFACAGGESEACARSMYREMDKKELQDPRINKLRGTKEIREFDLETQKGVIRIAAVNGLKNAIDLIEEMEAGKVSYDFIEVMACPEGCVNGGGQPIPANINAIRARNKSVYDQDKNESVKVAHKNNAVAKLYEEFARAPGSDESKDLFLTSFAARKVLK